MFLLDESAKKLLEHIYPVGTSPRMMSFRQPIGWDRVRRSGSPPVKAFRAPLGALNQDAGNLTEVMASNWSLSLVEYLPGHLQWIKDSLVDQENMLVDAVNQLECQIDATKYVEVQLLSRVSGILAAHRVGLMNCPHSFGDSAVIRLFDPMEANFSIEIADCGAQLKFGNFNIDQDGFRLTPFQPCYWQSHIANFNGISHMAHRDGWVKVAPTKALSHHLILSRFNSSADLSGELLAAAMEKERLRIVC